MKYVLASFVLNNGNDKEIDICVLFVPAANACKGRPKVWELQGHYGAAWSKIWKLSTMLD